MSWINRFTVPTGSALAIALALLTAPAAAQTALQASYQGQPLRFTHVSLRDGETAVGVEDPAFVALLRETGALLTWQPGARYVLITTSLPTVVSFAIGDRRYDVGPTALQAGIAPFVEGDEAYLPLREVLRALDLALYDDGGIAVLQPQLASLVVRQDGTRVSLLAHGGAPLHARVVSEDPTSVLYAFDGVGSTLAVARRIDAAGVAGVTITASGTILQPVTFVRVALQAGAVAEPPENPDGRDVLLVFDGPSTGAYQGPPGPGASPTPEAPLPGAANATVGGVTVTPGADGVTVDVAVSGDASYVWHRLRDPDNRFWVDIAGAQLQGPPIERSGVDPLLSIRVRQDGPGAVRVALSLAGPKALTVVPTASGLEIAIGSQDVAGAPRAGAGSIGSAPSVAAAPAPPPSGATSGWKFAPRAVSGYVPTNPRLIVIDPGHGGSDPGTVRNGVSEATLTLDMAKRLRAILVARGWEVKLTHEADVDVYAPDDSARDELQARVNIANEAGARLFVSIHANAYVNAGPSGTTLYVSKPEDVAFARSVESETASDGTADDGIVKSRLYVTLHTRMPAVLIETAFLSNPNDYALLTSEAWRQKVAEEIADGIGRYARAYPVGNQPSQ